LHVFAFHHPTLIPTTNFITSSISKSSSLCLSSNNYNEKEEGDWSKKAEWALVDIVPKYTVYSTSTEGSVVTFWTQLLHSTMEIQSKRSEMEAWRRYKELCNDMRYKKDTENKELQPAGPSPSLLQDWRIMDGEKTIFIGGTLSENGNRIWFPLQSIGRLANDPMGELMMNDSTSWSLLNPTSLEGGYAEASGGTIYELGYAAKALTSTTTNPIRNDFQMETATTIKEEGKSKQLMDKLNSMLSGQNSSNIEGAVATISAVLATSILSLYIGFGMGAGTAFSSGANVARTTLPPSSLPKAVIVLKTLPPSSSSTSTSTSTSASTTMVGPSATELRARQETRVLRERRLIDNVSRRLEVDEMKLVDLMKQEQADATSTAILDSKSR